MIKENLIGNLGDVFCAHNFLSLIAVAVKRIIVILLVVRSIIEHAWLIILILSRGDLIEEQPEVILNETC